MSEIELYDSLERMFKNKPTHANLAITLYKFRREVFDILMSEAYSAGSDGQNEHIVESEPVADINDLD